IQFAAGSDDTQVILLQAAAGRLRNDGKDVLADAAEPGLRDDVARERFAGHRVVDEAGKQFGEISLALLGGRHVEKPGRRVCAAEILEGEKEEGPVLAV